MSQTVETLLNYKKQSSGILTIQLIKEVGNATFIVGDNSGVAIMDISDKPSYGKLMNKGCWYKLIKCHKINENSIKPNDNFKPIKYKVFWSIFSIPKRLFFEPRTNLGFWSQEW